jgi:hypothetical protein
MNEQIRGCYIKAELISSSNPDTLQARLDAWLARNKNTLIINMQYQASEHSYSVLITWRVNA